MLMLTLMMMRVWNCTFWCVFSSVFWGLYWFWCWNRKELTQTFRPSVWWQNVGTIEDQRETWLLWIYLNICKNDGEYLQQCLSSRDKTSSLEYFAPHEMMIIHIVLFCFCLCLMHLMQYDETYVLTFVFLKLEGEKSFNEMCLCPNPGFQEWDTPGAAAAKFCAFLINVSPPMCHLARYSHS